MFNEKDILARLQKGESMEDITSEWTDAVTKAQASYDKINERKRQESEIFEKKKAYMNQLIKDIGNYFKTFYEAEFDQVDLSFSEKEVEDIVRETDASFKNLTSLKELFGGFDSLFKSAPDPDATIKNFLFKNKW